MLVKEKESKGKKNLVFFFSEAMKNLKKSCPVSYAASSTIKLSAPDPI